MLVLFLELFSYFICFVGYFCYLAFEEIYLILASATFCEIIFYVVGVLSYLIFKSL